jgi:RNA polymerase sigma factor (sigma-70 family)
MARHGWKLLAEDDFSRQLYGRAKAAGITDAEALTSLAVNLYCQVWHTACCSRGEQRKRAFSELAHYLYDRALHKYGERELAHEVAHDAIVLIHEQLENCQNPGAFMAFALLKLWNAATTYFRRRDRLLAQLSLEGEEEEEAEIVDRQSVGPEAATLQTELVETLLWRIGELMQAEPRAQKQYQAVLYKFIYGYSDQEIADHLEMDVAGVHVLRSRGMKRLREDPALRRLAQDFL